MRELTTQQANFDRYHHPSYIKIESQEAKIRVQINTTDSLSASTRAKPLSRGSKNKRLLRPAPILKPTNFSNRRFKGKSTTGSLRSFCPSSRSWKAWTFTTSAFSYSRSRCQEDMKTSSWSCRFSSCLWINRTIRVDLVLWGLLMTILRWQRSVRLTYEYYFLARCIIRIRICFEGIAYSINLENLRATNIDWIAKKTSRDFTW